MPLTIDSDVNNVRAGGGAGQHAGSSDAGSVVRVDMDGEVGVLLAEGTNEPADR